MTREAPSTSTRTVMAELEATLGPLVGGRVYRAPTDGAKLATPYVTAARVPDAVAAGVTLNGRPSLTFEQWEVVVWSPNAEEAERVSQQMQAALRGLRTKRIAGAFVRAAYDLPEPALRLRGAAHRVDFVTRELAT